MPTSPSRPGAYTLRPTTVLPPETRIHTGPEVWTTLATAVRSRAHIPLLAIDTYPGTHLEDLANTLARHLPEMTVLNVEEEAARDSEVIEALLRPYLTDDPVLGVMAPLGIDDFYDEAALASLREHIATSTEPMVVIGWGASLVASREHLLVLGDIARWEIQSRFRAGGSNWRALNHDQTPQEKFKRGYFVEWRAADRHKLGLLKRMDFFLDSNRVFEKTSLISGSDYRSALQSLTSRPFRLVPYFDPGVWGGQWMREKFDLPPDVPNYAWCFDCVPEENSLVFEGGGATIESPAMNLVLTEGPGLLGQHTHERFGAEFPIRFDMLDTMEGGNLSLQVHPLTAYIRERFGMYYTQDESYYILDASEDSTIYLGLREGIDKVAMATELRAAARGDRPFPADAYVNTFPVQKHDHFSIPAGTIHCSGKNTMVLEISATPYIFTFKLWDWGRVDLNGKPRPLHIDHGLANIAWDRDTSWVDRELRRPAEPLVSESGVVEERTGLHHLEFIETRRCWFDHEAHHDTQGTVTVMTLVEGDVAEIVSPDGAFPPFPLHYAETVVIPAGVGRYVVRRGDAAQANRLATIRAWVRGTEVLGP